MRQHTEHSTTVQAPADTVYGLLADVTGWPLIFPPTVHAVRESAEPAGGGTREVIRLWATANGDVKTWTSRRDLDPVARRITFRQQKSQDPVAEMGGAWLIEPRGDGACTVRLLHDFRAVGDEPDRIEWIRQAVERNSTAELGALREAAEGAAGATALEFTDSIRLAGPLEDAYRFIHEADRWETRLPHVERVVMTEDTPNIQVLEMDTRTATGQSHTTKSIRVCFPSSSIVYKQIVVPALMSAHLGRWDFTARPDGTTEVSSWHAVRIREENIERVLGPGADLAQAREFLRNALGGNSRATLGHTRDHAENNIAATHQG